MLENRWQDTLDEAMNRHNAELRRLSEQTSRAEQDLENSKINLERIRVRMDAEIEKNKAELNKIISWRNDPVVYVRNYNETTVYVYHGSLSCGRIPYYTKPMLLGEARNVGLHPCYSCGYLASSPAAA